MHFSIPDTRLVTRSHQSFITYNIHINGTYHCSLRYRQLFEFYLQLRKRFGESTFSEFPPKKLFQLSVVQLEERRSQLERFLQIASQDSRVVRSRLFNGFLLAAQQESAQNNEQSGGSTTSLDIYQLNWHSTTLSTDTTFENTDVVLGRYCRELKLDAQFVPYFALYLVRRVDNDYRVVRSLESYESPGLTLATVNQTVSPGHVIVIRKSYWNAQLDDDLFGERVALNLIYWQALHEIEKGHVQASREMRNRLTALQAKGDKVEYLRIVRNLRHYGHVHFDVCHCDYPAPKTPIRLSAGNFTLCFRMVDTDDEISFRVLRIKCWRLTTISSNESTTEDDAPVDSSCPYELAFEYLVTKGELKWITIRSPQAVLLSTCLQSMVEEMLLKKEGKKLKNERLEMHYNTSPSYSANQSHTESNGDAHSGLAHKSPPDWTFCKLDGTKANSKIYKLEDDTFVNSSKVIEIDNRSNRIHYNANLVFNDIADDDL